MGCLIRTEHRAKTFIFIVSSKKGHGMRGPNEWIVSTADHPKWETNHPKWEVHAISPTDWSTNFTDNLSAWNVVMFAGLQIDRQKKSGMFAGPQIWRQIMSAWNGPRSAWNILLVRFAGLADSNEMYGKKNNTQKKYGLYGLKYNNCSSVIGSCEII